MDKSLLFEHWKKMLLFTFLLTAKESYKSDLLMAVMHCT
jgi:hypothetical protein